MQEYAKHLGKDLATLEADDLLHFVRQMTLLGLSLQTRGRRITALRQFYDWLRQRKHTVASVAQDLRPPKRPQTVHHWGH